MKIYLYAYKGQGKEYNIRLLRYLLKKEGIETINNPNDADIIWVSICDISEIEYILKVKGYNKPILVGGFIAHLPLFRLLFDFTNMGEAYNMIRELPSISNVGEFGNIQNIRTKDKEGILDEFIDFNANPIIKVTNRAYYYYCGKGCPQKCKFCVYGNARKYQIVPKDLFLKAVRSIPEGKKLYPMLSYLPYKWLSESYSKKLGILDVKIREYLKGYSCGVSTIRTGVEFFNPHNRHIISKTISNEAIYEFIELTKNEKKQVALYFIAGLEEQEEMWKFINAIPQDNKLYPRINCIFTYIDANPGTPMEDYDIRGKITFDREIFFKEANKKNRRFRTHVMKYKAYSTWRTLMVRIKNEDQFHFVYNLRKMKDNELMLNKIEKSYPELLGSRSLKSLIEQWEKEKINKKELVKVRKSIK